MNLNFVLFVIIPFVLMLITSIAFPLYRIKLMKTAGEKLLPLTKKNAKLSYTASGVAVVLLLLSIKFDFGRLNFIIPYCAVLGFVVATRESTFLPVNGVYETLLITGSEILKYEDIQSLPSPLSTDPDNTITVPLKKGPSRHLVFNNSNEAFEVRHILEKKMHV